MKKPKLKFVDSKLNNIKFDHLINNQLIVSISYLPSFQQQAAADQSAAIRPDTKSPFKSRGDACKRLLRYHVFNTPVPSEEQLSKGKQSN